MIRLSPRLALVASLAGRGGSAVDVGTDHGYVPVYFAQNNLFDRIAASDINPGPLESARESAREYGVLDKISFFLSDGLRSVPGEFGTVVIAGMGGETMVDIISSCPWIGGARLILQPQSKADVLSWYLDGAGFVCRRAGICRDAGHLYVAFEARAGEGGFDMARSLISARDGLLGEAVGRELARVGRAVSGMESARSTRDSAHEIDRLNKRRLKLERLLEETKKWQN